MDTNSAGHHRLPLAMLAAFAALPLVVQPTPIEQGRAAINHGDSDAAIEILEKAVAQAPKSAEAHYVLGSAYGVKVQAGGMLAAAKYGSKLKDEFEKAVALDPKYVDARYVLVQVYTEAPGIMGGSYEKAFDQAKEIKTIDPVLGHRAYAFIYSHQKKLDLANKEYADAIREEPKSGKAHSFYGQYLASVPKSYATALVELETALKIDPHYMPALYHLGRIASLANTNLARGEEALKQYLTYMPKDNEPTPASAHTFLGAVYEKEGKKAEAKQAYETALKLNPTLKSAAEGLKRVS